MIAGSLLLTQRNQCYRDLSCLKFKTFSTCRLNNLFLKNHWQRQALICFISQVLNNRDSVLRAGACSMEGLGQ